MVPGKLFIKDGFQDGEPCPGISKGNREISNNFRVCLKISGEVQDETFIVFLEEEQRKRDKYHKLGVSEIISLYKIKNGTSLDYLEEDVVQNLLNQELIKRNGKSSSTRYVLSDRYFALAHKTSQIAGYSIAEINGIAECLSRVKTAKMKDFAALFEGKLKRSQIRYLIEKMAWGTYRPFGSTEGGHGLHRFFFFANHDRL